MVEMVLVAEELGRAAAPLPVIDVVVATRMLARLDTAEARALLGRALGGAVVSLAVGYEDESGRRLVPSGAVAETVIGRVGTAVVGASHDEAPAHVANLASAPLAWWVLDQGEMIAEGDSAVESFTLAELEWRLLTAAMLIGAGESAMQLAADYARERTAFGVPIGTFQAVAHPLADVTIAVESGRRLVRKAAWFLEHEPDSVGSLVTMASLQAAEAAEQAGSTGIRVQGGFGFTLESDLQLYFRRAKGWGLLGESGAGHLKRIADELLGPASGLS